MMWRPTAHTVNSLLSAAYGRGSYQSFEIVRVLSSYVSPPALQQTEQGKERGDWWRSLVVGVASSAALLSTLANARDHPHQTSPETGKGPESENRFHMLSLQQRRRIFFKYEKRIRDLSSLEKVFHYFATQEADGLRCMGPQDMLRSLVPTYPPRASSIERAGHLDGERHTREEVVEVQDSLFKKVDVDGDGLVSFAEYILLIALLAIHEEDMQTVFNVVDDDSSGSIDLEEFVKLIQMLQKRTQRSRDQKANKLLMQIKLDLQNPRGLFLAFFGRDLKKKIRPAEFLAFLTSLHMELVRLEFAHYDLHNTGTVAGIDFATSLVTSADLRQVDELLDKVDNLPPELAEARISFNDFLSVHSLRRNLHKLDVALEFYEKLKHHIKKTDLQRIIRKNLGFELSPQVLDILFAVFSNEEGYLRPRQMVDVLGNRDHLPGRQGATSNHASSSDGSVLSQLGGVFGCMWGCMDPQGNEGGVVVE